MTIEEMISEYNACYAVNQGKKEFFLALEEAAAEELIEAKESLESDIVRESGLKLIKTTEKLREDRKKLLKAAGFFSEMSVFDTCIADGEIDGDTAHALQMQMENCWLFPHTMLMWLIALLWHTGEEKPTSLHLCFSEESDMETLMPALGEFVLPLFPEIKAVYTSVETEDCDDEEDEEDDSLNGLIIQTGRPMQNEDFKTVERLLGELKEEPELYLTVEFDELPVKDPISELQVCADEEGYNIAVVYDLSETDPEQEQRVLAGGLESLEAVTAFFYRICVDGALLADIPNTADFMDITE